MRTYLIYDTKEEAIQAERIIFSAGKSLAALKGYTTNGSIHGKQDGISTPETAETLYWDTPLQRLDGKWVVLHPMHHPVAQSHIPVDQEAYRNLLEALSAGESGSAVVEVNDISWWPEPQGDE